MSAPLTWTYDRPTAPGWYWLRMVGEDDEVVEVYHEGDGDLATERFGSRSGAINLNLVAGEYFDGCAWSGPLTPPGEDRIQPATEGYDPPGPDTITCGDLLGLRREGAS